MANNACIDLLHKAEEAFVADELNVMLEQAVAASRCANRNLEAEALFWVALAHDALGHHAEAQRIWRQARDHPAANASQPLLSLRAEYNITRLLDSTGDEAVRARRALALDLAARLTQPPDRPFAELATLAYQHLRSLVSFYQYVDVPPLAEAILASQEGEKAALAPELLWETRRCDLVANLDLRATDDVQRRFDEFTNGDEVALKVLEEWAARLKRAGDNADGQLVLTAAWLRILILGNLGRSDEAEAVLGEAEATQAGQNPEYAPIVAGLRDAVE